MVPSKRLSTADTNTDPGQETGKLCRQHVCGEKTPARTAPPGSATRDGSEWVPSRGWGTKLGLALPAASGIIRRLHEKLAVF